MTTLYHLDFDRAEGLNPLCLDGIIHAGCVLLLKAHSRPRSTVTKPPTKQFAPHPALRRRQALTGLLLLVVAAFPCAAAAQEPPARAPLVVVTDDNYPPYVFRDASGTLFG